MALTTYKASAVAANTPFTFTVPGQRLWVLLSVVAVLSRAVGGTPTRTLSLRVTDGTNLIMASPALDAGTEPGTLTATWTAANPANVASGATGITLGPVPQITCLPGYVITGNIVNGAVADQWTSAVAWVDERYTG